MPHHVRGIWLLVFKHLKEEKASVKIYIRRGKVPGNKMYKFRNQFYFHLISIKFVREIPMC